MIRVTHGCDYLTKPMYTLFNWLDHRYHPNFWVKLGVLAFFVLGSLGKAADKKRPASGSSIGSGRGREMTSDHTQSASADWLRLDDLDQRRPEPTVSLSAAQPTNGSTTNICGILSLVISPIGIVVLYGPCGIAAVILGVIGVVGGRGTGVKAASILGIVIGTLEILLFGFFLLTLASSTQ